MRAPKLLSLVVGITFAFPIHAGGAAAENSREARGEARPGGEFGTVFGKVSLAGHSLKPKPLPVFKNRAFCGATVADETLLVGADGGLANAVVVFRSLQRATPAQPGLLALDNKKCAFTPHAQVGVVGSELLLKNSDPILHTVHARMGNDTLFNVGLPTWRRVTKRLERAGVIRINCDVLHTWMSAVMVVTESPFFALTNAVGDFELDNLPVGDYVMEVWHERLGLRQQRFAVNASGIAHIQVIYNQEIQR
ncbi:MAG TPA: hypothetical protein VH985_02015 [Candidatus Binatia bacterium]